VAKAMNMETMIGYLLGIFVMNPIIFILYSCSVMLFIKLLGGKLYKITIGYGEHTFKISNLISIKEKYFMNGEIQYTLKSRNLNEKMIKWIGLLSLLVMAIALWVILEIHLIPTYFLFKYFIFFTFINVIAGSFTKHFNLVKISGK
jgi:hypothetical protein